MHLSIDFHGVDYSYKNSSIICELVYYLTYKFLIDHSLDKINNDYATNKPFQWQRGKHCQSTRGWEENSPRIYEKNHDIHDTIFQHIWATVSTPLSGETRKDSRPKIYKEMTTPYSA